MNVADLRLCYVRRGYAHFTSAPLELQWGDGWRKAPYEHNSSEPYEDIKGVAYQVVAVAYRHHAYETPDTGHVNSPWSVQRINSGAVAWLSTSEHDPAMPPIQAGTSLREFVRIINATGGTVYAERATWEGL